MGTFFTKKSIEAIVKESGEKGGFNRHLSAMNLIALGIGVIVGTGIFVITGTAAANNAGPALTLSFVISGIGCMMAAMCYAEFAAMMPVSGSAYAYSYTTLGEGPAWYIGWMLLLEYLFAAAIVAGGCSSYILSFLSDFNIYLPVEICETPYKYVDGAWVRTEGFLNLPAMLIVAVLSMFLLRGINQSAWVNNLIVVIKLVVILVFIGVGVSYIDTSNWVPYIPENTGDFGEFGWSGVLRGAGIVFFAYLGFDAMSTAAQEARNPQKDMPKAIIISLFVCTLLYVAVTAVLTGIVNYKELNVTAPIALAIDHTGLTWLSPLIKIGAVAGIISVVLVLLLAQSRLYYAMSKDGLIFRMFSDIHSKHKTPRKGTIFAAIVTGLLAAFAPVAVLGELVSIGTLIAFASVCISVMILRKTQPDAHRPFRTPYVPFVPLLGAFICIVQIIVLPGETWARLLVWIALGTAMYFLYGRRHSKLKKKKNSAS